MKRHSLSTILAPIVAENARRAAARGQQPAAPKRLYKNVEPQRDRNGNILVAPYDAN